MPLMLAYRYQNQIIDNIKNGNGLGVAEYDNPDNSTIMAAIPIMDPARLRDVFESTFDKIGHLGAKNSFSHNSCVVDLNPDPSQYDVDLGPVEFPMTFAGTLNVNADDTYKKDKLILTRVPSISGPKFDTFEMGSHSFDYDLITDMEDRKYRDRGSNPDGAVDDYITVTLGNGGSCQKKQIDVEKNTDVEHDLYAIPMSTNWGGETTYKTGDCVRLYDNQGKPKFYTSKVDNNQNNRPPDENYWDPIEVSETELEKLEKKY